MAFDVFTPPRDPSAGNLTERAEAIELEAAFGDGYEQTVQFGLRDERLVLQMVWQKLPAVDAEGIDAFLRDHKHAPFWWTLPGTARTYAFTCRSREMVHLSASRRRLTATLRQTFEPES